MLPANGLYSLQVFESGNDQPLEYTLVLERIAPPSPTASPICRGCTISDGMIDPAADLDIVVFEGRAGDTVTVQAASQSGGIPCLELFRPDGSFVPPAHCGSTAQVNATLDQSGPYSILVSEAVNDQTVNYVLSYQCLGTCPPTTGLVCDIQMSQQTYVDGETVTATVLRLANLTSMAVTTEVKIWLSLPGLPAASVANAVVPLPSGFDQNFGPVPLFQVVPAFPRGTYEFSCRFLHPVTGDLLVVDLNPFQIQ